MFGPGIYLHDEEFANVIALKSDPYNKTGMVIKCEVIFKNLKIFKKNNYFND